MDITCTHCRKNLRIPDEKVPDRVFALTCPSCKKKFQVDPNEPPPAAEEPDDGVDMSFAGLGDDDDGESSRVTPPPDLGGDLGSTTPPPATQETTTATGATPTGGFRPLRALQPAEKQLLDRLSPLGAIVNLTDDGDAVVEKALDLVGMHEVHHYDSVEAVADAMTELDMGIVVLKVEKASAPPFEALQPIHWLPMQLRRRTVVALMADNIRSHDGQVAFFLQVNCTISSKDQAKLPDLLRRAVLHHLQLYRFWEQT